MIDWHCYRSATEYKRSRRHGRTQLVHSRNGGSFGKNNGAVVWWELLELAADDDEGGTATTMTTTILMEESVCESTSD